MKVLFDTNILVDYLRGEVKAHNELHKHIDPLISLITWMEIMVGIDEGTEQRLIDLFFSQFQIIPIDQNISKMSVDLRRKYKMKLPDAIIWASAKVHNAVLMTRNTKDFSDEEADICYPYYL